MSFVNILLAILVLSFIVLVHELGHYLVGRVLGFGIQEFAIGFGPKVFGWRRKDIDYSFRAFPLGGYVRYLDEDSEGTDPRAYNNMPAWKRFLSILAGPAMNFVLAFVITFVCFAVIGLPVGMNVPSVAEVSSDMPAAEAGLQVGDKITAVDGTPISFDTEGYRKMSELFAAHDVNTPVTLTIERAGQTMDLSVGLKEVDGAKRIGISIGYVTQHVPIPVGESFTQAGRYVSNASTAILDFLRQMTYNREVQEQTAGPIGTIGVVSKTIADGYENTLYMIVFISINLGVFNLLPIPGLDGGRLLFAVIEMVRRKPINREREGLVHLIGMAAVLLLIVFFTYRDIVRMVAG